MKWADIKNFGMFLTAPIALMQRKNTIIYPFTLFTEFNQQQ